MPTLRLRLFGLELLSIEQGEPELPEHEHINVTASTTSEHFGFAE